MNNTDHLVPYPQYCLDKFFVGQDVSEDIDPDFDEDTDSGIGYLLKESWNWLYDKVQDEKDFKDFDPLTIETEKSAINIAIKLQARLKVIVGGNNHE